MKWIALLVITPFAAGLAASYYWRASKALEALGCGLIGALASMLVAIPFLPIEGWGILGVLVVFVTPVLSLPAAVAGAVAGMTLAALRRTPE